MPPAFFRSPAYRNALTKRISFSDRQFRPLPMKRKVLWISTDHTKGMKNILRAKFRRPLNARVAVHNAAIAQ